MNYNIAKKLYDNGFEFETSTVKNGLDTIKLAIPTTEKIINYLDTSLKIVKFNDEWFFIPTLEELINVCPKDISEDENVYYRFLRQDRTGKWFAGYCDEKGEIETGYYGETPVEAYANLWMEINNIFNRIKNKDNDK